MIQPTSAGRRQRKKAVAEQIILEIIYYHFLGIIVLL